MNVRIGVVLGLILALGVPNVLIAQREKALRSGTVMAIPLAPVDPRSLMGGDYMALRFGLVPRDRVWDQNTVRLKWPRDGHVVVTVDAHQVAHFVRLHTGSPRKSGEHLLQYRIRGMDIRFASDAFYFQEGKAEHFAAAVYGVLRVADDGSAILVGLRDKNGRSL